MSFRAFWFIVAGFVLGFTVSTLWEWLYYRQKRQQTIPPRWESSPVERESPFSQERDGSETGERGARRAPAYRSSGVLLESEARVPVTEQTTPSAVGAPRDSEKPVEELGQQPTGDAEGSNERDGQERAQTLTIAALTAERGARDTSTTPTPTDPTTAALLHTAQKGREEQESLGNPAAIAKAGALAAASLAGDTTTRKPASVVNATPGEIPPSVQQPTQTSVAAEGEQEVNNRRAAAASAGPASNRPTEQPSRTVATHGFAQQTPPATPQPQPPTPAANPALRHRPTDYPDDLAMIKGIGEAYKRRLYATGIYTWRQLAETDTDSLRRITRAKPNADIESWLTQAMMLAEKYNRMGANFTGPLDDFTRIEGIGAITADMLYKAGLCTYEQLAGASP
ncbi:MAG TPA: helix-hairpin-helix domain-containing protein, partial [Caldilineaceae bacterium]|nr:helix-hairpin-helix domain-containing protein [Caldilineaceae bacterium]